MSDELKQTGNALMTTGWTPPTNAVRVSPPDFVTPDKFPIGGALIGKILAIDPDFTGNPDMKDCENIRLLASNGSEVWMPITGTLAHGIRYHANEKKLPIPAPGQKLKGSQAESWLVGKQIAIRRNEDGASKRYNNKMFKFELFFLE